MKKQVKKLSISKETLRSLEESSLEAVNGGVSLRQSNCDICTSTCP